MVTNPADMIQDQHDDISGTKRILMYGTTTTSSVLPISLNDDGTIKLSNYVPYIGATTDLDLGDHNLTASIGTFGAITNTTIDSFTNQVEADETHIRIRNESGSTMTKGQLVYISGYNVGLDRTLVNLTDASSASTMPALGMINDADISNNADGHCTIMGRVFNIDTSAFSVGETAYVSTTAGEMSTRPSGGTDQVQAIGIVLRSQANNGVIEIIGAGRTNDSPNTGHDAFADFVANEHIDWTDASENLDTLGTIKGESITSDTFFIGEATGSISASGGRVTISGGGAFPISFNQESIEAIDELTANSLRLFSGHSFTDVSGLVITSGTGTTSFNFGSLQDIDSIIADDTVTTGNLNTDNYNAQDGTFLFKWNGPHIDFAQIIDMNANNIVMGGGSITGADNITVSGTVDTAEIFRTSANLDIQKDGDGDVVLFANSPNRGGAGEGNSLTIKGYNSGSATVEGVSFFIDDDGDRLKVTRTHSTRVKGIDFQLPVFMDNLELPEYVIAADGFFTEFGSIQIGRLFHLTGLGGVHTIAKIIDTSEITSGTLLHLEESGSTDRTGNTLKIESFRSEFSTDLVDDYDVAHILRSSVVAGPPSATLTAQGSILKLEYEIPVATDLTDSVIGLEIVMGSDNAGNQSTGNAIDITHNGTGLAINTNAGITTTATIQGGDYKSGDGSQGITQLETGVTNFDIEIKDGLITSFTKN